MAIRRRLSKSKRLTYHRQYGSVENPPYSPRFPKELPIGLMTRVGVLETVMAPTGEIAKAKNPFKVMRFPKALWGKDPAKYRVPCGLIYNRSRGIGPGDGLSLWIVTNVCWTYRDETFPHSEQWTDEPEFRFLTVLRPSRPYPVNKVYRDHVEIRLIDKAHELIYEAYEELHDNSFPNITWAPLS